MIGEGNVALVTGSSTGIGFETSIALARKHFLTYATMRNLKDSKKLEETSQKEGLSIKCLVLDVTDEHSINTAVDKIYEDNKRIDVLVNNAGYALAGPLEETSKTEIQSQFDTNLFGAIRVMKKVIPIMRNQKSGTIVNISSMGGRVAVPLDSIYHATKFALEGLSECIRYELGSFGIRMILVEPGAVGSNFWNNMKISTKSTNPNSPYRKLIDDVSEIFSEMSINPISPAEVGKVVSEAILSKKPQFRYIVGKDADFVLSNRDKMSETEFEEFMKTQFKLSY